MKKIACLLLVLFLFCSCRNHKQSENTTINTAISAINDSLYLSNLYSGSYFIPKPYGISHNVNGFEYHECYVEVTDKTMSFIKDDSNMIELRGYDNYYTEMPITSIAELKLYTEQFYSPNGADQWLYSIFIDIDNPICIEFQGKLLWHSGDYFPTDSPDYNSIFVTNSDGVSIDFTVEYHHHFYDDIITENKYRLVLTDNIWKIDSREVI